MALPLADRGRGLLVASWRGFGDNPGQPSEVGLFADGAAFLAEAQRRSPEAPVVLFGYSTGAAVALNTARREEALLAVVTLGAFTDMPSLAPGLARGLMRDRFDNLSAIAEVHAPIFLIHARDDEVVPFDHAEALKAASGGQATLIAVTRGGHRLDLGTLTTALDRIEAEAAR